MSARDLLALLADGGVHSGEQLAQSMQISRTAVWKHIERLRTLGIAVTAQARAGYRLERAVEMLDAGRIAAGIGATRRTSLARLQVLFETGSTNTLLLTGAQPPAGQGYAALAEMQTEGRGRRGRRWVTPFGAGLALSMSWSFEHAPKDLSALSLAAGVGVARALSRLGARGVRLKWPNDIWFQDRKMGGILAEVRAESGGPAFVVVGLGLNLLHPAQVLPAPALAEIAAGGVAPAALAEACESPPSRNAVAAALLDEWLGILAEFQQTGFAPFRQEWLQLDALAGRAARVSLGEAEFLGTAGGIDADGGLLLEIQGQKRKFVSGEASLRPLAGAA